MGRLRRAQRDEVEVRKAKLPVEALEYFREQGRRGGKKAARNMTAKQRRDRARNAAKAREARKALRRSYRSLS